MEDETYRESFYIIELEPTEPADTSSSHFQLRSLSMIGNNSMFCDNSTFITFCREKDWQFGDDQRNIYSTHMLLRTLVLTQEEQDTNIIKSHNYHTLRYVIIKYNVYGFKIYTDFIF